MKKWIVVYLCSIFCVGCTAPKQDVILINALPASGKSETLRYIKSLSNEDRMRYFGIGEPLFLDDFPYVYAQRLISSSMIQKGSNGCFFRSEASAFSDSRDWVTLVHLINADFDDIMCLRKHNPKHAGQWLIQRILEARTKAGIPMNEDLSYDFFVKEIAEDINDFAIKFLEEKNANIPTNLKGKTIICEFSRGGCAGDVMPLPYPVGYQHAYEALSTKILEKASIFYIEVSPEESRRKDAARAVKGLEGSSLNHSICLSVLYSDYGIDDINYLKSQSEYKDTIHIVKNGKPYNLPIGVFKNEPDITTFLRQDEKMWDKKKVKDLHNKLVDAFDHIKSGELSRNSK